MGPRGRCDVNKDTVGKLSRENEWRLQRQGSLKKVRVGSWEHYSTSAGLEDSGNDTSRTSVMDSWNWSSMLSVSIQEQEHKIKIGTMATMEEGGWIAESKDHEMSVSVSPSRRVSCKGNETESGAPSLEEGGLRRKPEPMEGGEGEPATGALLVNFGEKKLKSRRRRKRI